MDVEAIREIGQEILKHAERFDMRDWVRQTGCGTVACFAGFWAFKDLGKHIDDHIELRKMLDLYCLPYDSRIALDLPNAEIFYKEDWPERLPTAYPPRTLEYAQHFVNVVLEDYIETDGWQND